MLLAIDIGNTNVTLGLYDGEILGAHWRFATSRVNLPDECGALMLDFFHQAGISAGDIQAAAIASVVPPGTGIIAESCKRYFHCDPLIVTGTTRTGVRILYDDPTQVGADRIVDVAA
jgi:type III pantothenate kinase